MLKIYKIVDNTNGNIYIGKTQSTLSDRLAQHRYNYRKNLSCHSKEIIKNGDFKIEIIEETDDETRERYWIENTECVNKNIPGRTDAEYRKNNREKRNEYNKKNMKEYMKEYRENNKKKAKEYNKIYSKIRDKWHTSMGGNPYKNNMSLLKIDPNLFLI